MILVLLFGSLDSNSLLNPFQVHGATEALATLKNKGLPMTEHTYDILAHTYIHAFQPAKALETVKEMVGKSVWSCQLIVYSSLKCVDILTNAFVSFCSVPTQLDAGFLPSRALLLHLRRRCSRGSLSEGVEFAEATITWLKYRPVSLDEKNRRQQVHELSDHKRFFRR